MNEVYLGDGLYASFDKQSETITLRAPRYASDHWVALEPQVMINFQSYLRKIAHDNPEMKTLWGKTDGNRT